MTLGLFGGSFNPPHLGHLALAEACAEAAGLDRVLWTPAPAPPHKAGAGLVAPEHRLAMVRLATEGNARFAVSDARVPPARAALHRRHAPRAPARRTRMPTSCLSSAATASRASIRGASPTSILAMARLVVYRRPGADVADVGPGVLARTTIAEGPALDLSATDLRARIAAGRSVRYLVPDAVRAYLAAHALYAS